MPWLGYALTFMVVLVLRKLDPEFNLTNVTFVAIFMLNIF